MEEFTGNSLTYISHEELESIPSWLASKYGALAERLDLSYNGLKSLEGIVGFGHVCELILDNNKLTENAIFHKNENLQTLTLNKNNIKTLDKLVLKLAANFPNLTYLSLLGNDACPDQLTGNGNDDNDYQRYRYFILYHLPNLKFLDSTIVTEEEWKEAQRIGAFMNTVSADTVTTSNELRNKRQERDDIRSPYNPLPNIDSKEGDHKSSFGKCRYIYHGKQSEGNRFIMDGDL